MPRSFWALLIALFFAVAIVRAQSEDVDPESGEQEDAWYGVDENAKAGVFTYVNKNKLYVFAVNVNADGDLYFHMSAPISQSSWVGAGIGTDMHNAFMLIAYPSDNGLNVTISPRISSGHNEPVHDESIVIEQLYKDPYAPEANTVTHDGTGSINAHAICHNCSRWASGFLDTENEFQPWLFAMGPKKEFRSDSRDANLPRHDFYGHFTMNMPDATNSSGPYARVPAPNKPHFVFPPGNDMFASAGTSAAYDESGDSDRRPAAHGALMCVAFIALFPGGAVLLRLLKSVLYHAAIQVLGVACVTAAMVVAIYLSKLYNKSQNYTSAHQIIGFLIFAALFLQLGLGLLHHALYAKTKSPTPMGRIHMLLGPLVMVLGLVNIGVGFNFAGNSHYNTPFGIIVGCLVFLGLAALGCVYWCRNRSRYRPERDPYTDPYLVEQESRQGSDGTGMYSDYELRREPSSTFGTEPPEPYEAQTPYTPQVVSAPPWSPADAYTPVTPKTWKKEEITNFPRKPFDYY